MRCLRRKKYCHYGALPSPRITAAATEIAEAACDRTIEEIGESRRRNDHQPPSIVRHQQECHCERNAEKADQVGRCPPQAALLPPPCRTSFGHASPSAIVSVQDTLIRPPAPPFLVAPSIS